MTQSFRGDRVHIAVLGRCNTGKSTVLNHIVGQHAAIVSDQPGTTGDPVPLPFELLPLGPVTFYDTAGLDEDSSLGLLRRKAGKRILALADMAIVVTDEHGIGVWEKDIIDALRMLSTSILIVFNKQDIRKPSTSDLAWCTEHALPFFTLSAAQETEPNAIRQTIVSLVPAPETQPSIVVDLLPEQATVICVTPIDASAPKGRLIAPQIQVLRELVEYGHLSLTVQPAGLSAALTRLTTLPDLVITDSQVVREVVEFLPQTVSVTTFSLLFSRLKGDFALQLHGAKTLCNLKAGDRILMAEACSHHPQEEDIARIKLPKLLNRYSGHDLPFTVCSGKDFPEDLHEYALVVHCGGCMINRGEMRRRLRLCAAANVPVTNFGMVLSQAQGVLDRVSAPLLG